MSPNTKMNTEDKLRNESRIIGTNQEKMLGAAKREPIAENERDRGVQSEGEGLTQGIPVKSSSVNRDQ